MEYNFAVNISGIEELITTFDEKIEVIETIKTDLLDEGLYAMKRLDTNGIWKGSIYEAFRDSTFNGAAAVETAITGSIEVLKAFRDVLTAAKDSASTEIMNK